jgi:hypothetical protein
LKVGRERIGSPRKKISPAFGPDERHDLVG